MVVVVTARVPGRTASSSSSPLRPIVATGSCTTVVLAPCSSRAQSVATKPCTTPWTARRWQTVVTMRFITPCTATCVVVNWGIGTGTSTNRRSHARKIHRRNVMPVFPDSSIRCRAAHHKQVSQSYVRVQPRHSPHRSEMFFWGFWFCGSVSKGTIKKSERGWVRS